MHMFKEQCQLFCFKEKGGRCTKIKDWEWECTGCVRE